MKLKLKPEKIKSISKLQKSVIDQARDTCHKELGPILNELSKNPNNKVLQQMLKKFFVIRSVTIVENYYTDLLADLLDYDTSLQGKLDVHELIINIGQFDYIKKKSTTRGKILATNFNLQDPAEINHTFSKIFGIKFFERLQEYASKHVFSKNNPKLIKDEIDLLTNWSSFYELFDLRHQVVHSHKATVTLGVKKLESLFRNLGVFLMLSYMVVTFQMLWISNKENILEDMKKGKFLWDPDIDYRSIYPELKNQFPKSN